MKSFLLTLMLSLLVGVCMIAQNLNVYKTNGSLLTMPLSNIDSITFSDGVIGGQGEPCPDAPTVTDIDGNVYNTVLIGNQCWMKENLRVTKNPQGSAITRYCYANNNNNCLLYGGLYTWTTIMNGTGSSNANPSGVQGICPDNWHLPSDAEWYELTEYISKFNNQKVGNQLKSCRQVASPVGGECNTTAHPRWNSHLVEFGTDQYNFSALPGGNRSGTSFGALGLYGVWWTSTEAQEQVSAWYRVIYHYDFDVNRHNYLWGTAHSIRCVRD